MRRRSRIRRVMKWVGTVVCVLIAAAWVTSTFWHVACIGGGQAVWMESGAVNIRPHVHWASRPRALFFMRLTDATVEFWFPTTKRIGTSQDYRAIVPFWILLVPIVLPTAYLWWLDRRRFPPGHCQHCGYDLTGNVSGRCPECGQPVGKDEVESPHDAA